MTPRDKTVEAITAHGNATYACGEWDGEWDGEYQSDRYETVKETADRTRAALLAAIDDELAEERERVIALAYSDEIEREAASLFFWSLDGKRLWRLASLSDQAHYKTAAIRARKESPLGEGN